MFIKLFEYFQVKLHFTWLVSAVHNAWTHFNFIGSNTCTNVPTCPTAIGFVHNLSICPNNRCFHYDVQYYRRNCHRHAFQISSFTKRHISFAVWCSFVKPLVKIQVSHLNTTSRSYHYSVTPPVDCSMKLRTVPAALWQRSSIPGGASCCGATCPRCQQKRLSLRYQHCFT